MDPLEYSEGGLTEWVNFNEKRKKSSQGRFLGTDCLGSNPDR